MAEAAGFIFVTCQCGAEAAVKSEVRRRRPDFRFAYSRPGFLTFKLPPDARVGEDFELPLVFGRAWGFSLGKASGQDDEQLAAAVWQIAGGEGFDRLHVWPRDAHPAGEHGYEPGQTPESLAAREMLLSQVPDEPARQRLARRTRPGQRVLDVILVEREVWWVGRHLARDVTGCWPGGLCELELPYEAVSRAWLKMEEALLWAGFPLQEGDECVEIGCAPGGSCQALLERGMRVTGIDPAEMHPAVLGNPAFVHVRKRGAEVRRREFRHTRWLFADMNVAPNYTLDTVEAIVTHAAVNVRGVMLTLKLLDWSQAEHLPEYLARVRCWGFADVRARQLHHNRQEVCVAALAAGEAGKPGRRRYVHRPRGSRRHSPPLAVDEDA